MSTVNRIQFTATIHAPAAMVWHHITSIESYKHWTSAFAEGSCFQGSWDTGSKIRFLSPSGDGMVAEIAESRKNEFISIRHLGFISNGTEDTTSDAIRSWAPAYENNGFMGYISQLHHTAPSGHTDSLITRLKEIRTVIGVIVEPDYDEQEQAAELVWAVAEELDALVFAADSVFSFSGEPLVGPAADA